MRNSSINLICTCLLIDFYDFDKVGQQRYWKASVMEGFLSIYARLYNPCKIQIYNKQIIYLLLNT